MPSALAITRSRGVVMKPAHEVGAGPDVGGRHADDGDVAARVLAHAQRADRLEPGDQDHQVDDDGEDRPADEDVGELHQLSSGFGRRVVRGLDRVVDLRPRPRCGA